MSVNNQCTADHGTYQDCYSTLKENNNTGQNTIDQESSTINTMYTNMMTANNELMLKNNGLVETDIYLQRKKQEYEGLERNLVSKTAMSESVSGQLYFSYISVAILIIIILKLTILPNTSIFKMSFIIIMIAAIVISTMNLYKPSIFIIWVILVIYFLLWAKNIITFP